jgi:hypothetical protein
MIRGDRLSLLTDVDAPGSLISLGRSGRDEEEENNVQVWRVHACHYCAIFWSSRDMCLRLD